MFLWECPNNRKIMKNNRVFGGTGAPHFWTNQVVVSNGVRSIDSRGFISNIWGNMNNKNVRIQAAIIGN